MRVKTELEKKKRKIITALPDMTIDKAMDLMISEKIGCLPVLDHNKNLVGIISDKDIFKKIHETKGEFHHLNVEDLMTTELIVAQPEDDINFVAGIMDKYWIRHIPIIEDNQMVGLLSIGDINKVQMEDTEIENKYLKLYTSGLGLRDKSSDM